MLQPVRNWAVGLVAMATLALTGCGSSTVAGVDTRTTLHTMCLCPNSNGQMPSNPHRLPQCSGCPSIPVPTTTSP
jgi:hypothetical protein